MATSAPIAAALHAGLPSLRTTSIACTMAAGSVSWGSRSITARRTRGSLAAWAASAFAGTPLKSVSTSIATSREAGDPSAKSASTASWRSVQRRAGSRTIALSALATPGSSREPSAWIACRRLAEFGPFVACSSHHAMGISMVAVFSTATRGSTATRTGGPSSSHERVAVFSRVSMASMRSLPAVRTSTGSVKRKAGRFSSIVCTCSTVTVSVRVAPSHAGTTFNSGVPGRMHHWSKNHSSESPLASSRHLRKSSVSTVWSPKRFMYDCTPAKKTRSPSSSRSMWRMLAPLGYGFASRENVSPGSRQHLEHMASCGTSTRSRRATRALSSTSSK